MRQQKCLCSSTVLATMTCWSARRRWGSKSSKSNRAVGCSASARGGGGGGALVLRSAALRCYVHHLSVVCFEPLQLAIFCTHQPSAALRALGKTGGSAAVSLVECGHGVHAAAGAGQYVRKHCECRQQ